MFDKPHIINDHLKISETRSVTVNYLEEHAELYSSLAKTMWAYHEIGNLVPQTLDNMMSGHYFPYFESYYELENSYQLVLEGFYTYAFTALRSVLELGTLGVYFAIEDKEYEKVSPWIKSQHPTPRFRDVLKNLYMLDNFKHFDEKFNFKTRVLLTYSHLSDFVHTRGYRFSSSGQTLSNFNRFSEGTLKEYSEVLISIVSQVIITILLKYPIGLQGLPLDEKFGLNPPAGGFLRPDQVDLIGSVIEKEEMEFLKRVSDSDPHVGKIVEHITSLPDLSEEDWHRQREEFDKRFPGLKIERGKMATEKE